MSIKANTTEFIRFIAVGNKVFVSKRLTPGEDQGFDSVIQAAGATWDWEEAMVSYRLGFFRGTGGELKVSYADDMALREWARAAGYQLSFESSGWPVA